MAHQSAEQSKNENIRIMGDELGVVYSALWQELARLHQKWQQYVTLFGTTPERIALLNEVAPQTTYSIQESLWLDIILHIARLADSAKSGKPKNEKNNLSLRRFEILVQGSAIEEEVGTQVQKIKECTTFATDWRHRAYAHRDLDIALGNECAPLEPASRAAVKNALKAMSELMNLISKKYLRSTTLFDVDSTGAAGDAENLLRTLKNGMTHQEQIIEKVRAGELTWKDVHKPV